MSKSASGHRVTSRDAGDAARAPVCGRLTLARDARRSRQGRLRQSSTHRRRSRSHRSRRRRSPNRAQSRKRSSQRRMQRSRHPGSGPRSLSSPADGGGSAGAGESVGSGEATSAASLLSVLESGGLATHAAPKTPRESPKPDNDAIIFQLTNVLPPCPRRRRRCGADTVFMETAPSGVDGVPCHSRGTCPRHTARRPPRRGARCGRGRRPRARLESRTGGRPPRVYPSGRWLHGPALRRHRSRHDQLHRRRVRRREGHARPQRPGRDAHAEGRPHRRARDT